MAVLGAVLLAVAERVTVTVLEAGAGLAVEAGLTLGDGEPLDEQPVSAITADTARPVHSVFMIEI